MACIRILSRKGYDKNQERTSQIFDIIKQIERICDEYKYICDEPVGNKSQVSK